MTLDEVCKELERVVTVRKAWFEAGFNFQPDSDGERYLRLLVEHGRLLATMDRAENYTSREQIRAGFELGHHFALLELRAQEVLRG